MEIHRITESTTNTELARLIRHRIPFTNSLRTFRGLPLTREQADELARHPALRDRLSADSLLAFSLDVPNYVVFSRNTPIAWHSTTRGIEHRKDQSNWRWVTPRVTVWEDAATQRRFNRMVVITDGLNREHKGP